MSCRDVSVAKAAVMNILMTSLTAIDISCCFRMLAGWSFCLARKNAGHSSLRLCIAGHMSCRIYTDSILIAR